MWQSAKGRGGAQKKNSQINIYFPSAGNEIIVSIWNYNSIELNANGCWSFRLAWNGEVSKWLPISHFKLFSRKSLMKNFLFAGLELQLQRLKGSIIAIPLLEIIPALPFHSKPLCYQRHHTCNAARDMNDIKYPQMVYEMKMKRNDVQLFSEFLWFTWDKCVDINAVLMWRFSWMDWRRKLFIIIIITYNIFTPEGDLSFTFLYFFYNPCTSCQTPN